LEVVRSREIIDGFDLQFVEAAFDGEIGGIAERGKIRQGGVLCSGMGR
jgi:hypothetical protein